MTAYVPTATAPAAPAPKLTLIALTVLAAHALLLLGLPRWMRTVPVTGSPQVFQIRTITLAPPQPVAVAPVTPAQATPAPPSKPRPRPKPRHVPAPPVADLPIPDTSPVIPPPRSGTAALGGVPLPVVTVSNAQPPSSVPVTAGSDAPPSLWQAPPSIIFGGNRPLPPIVPPLPPEHIPVVLQQAAQPSPPSSAAPSASTANTPGAPEPIPPVLLPRPAEITYQATFTQDGRQVTLPSTVNWRYDEQFYDLRWILYGPAIGDHSHYATGLVAGRGLTPVTARAMGANAYNLTFDYAQSRLRNNPLPPASGAAPASTTASQPNPGGALPPGAQDSLSLLIELGALIAGNPSQYPVGSRIALPVADGRGPVPLPMGFTIVDDNGFTAAGQFAGQSLSALHLVHEAADNHDARIELWLGKQLDYLPLRLLINPFDDGQLDMTLQSAYPQTVRTRPALPAASSANSDHANSSPGAG